MLVFVVFKPFLSLLHILKDKLERLSHSDTLNLTYYLQERVDEQNLSLAFRWVVQNS